MDLATGAIGSLLPKLAVLCSDEYKLPNSLRQDIEFLYREMMSCRPALLKSAEVPLDQLDQQVRMWAEEVRELSYGIDDAVDSFLMASERLLSKMSKFFKGGKTRAEFTYAIKDIKARVKEISQRRERYKVDDVAPYSSSGTVDPRLAVLYQNSKDIVGIDQPMRDIIEKINSDEKGLKILSIFGCMGLGKTTLAKSVYDVSHSNFECLAFVFVGRQPDLKRTLKDLLAQISEQWNKDFSLLDEKQLIDAIRMFLQNKRFLIVIDDVWELRAWEMIRIALVESNCGSSVILTTRNFEVAQRAKVVYKLKPLSPWNSEKLFYKRLLIGKEGIHGEVAEVTKSIVQKCGCIPLAIITMASLLMGKPMEEWCVVRNLIGFGQEDDGVVKTTRKISLFSYYDIPIPLRTCLLHLRIFVEGYMIRKDTLIWKWIAEGFIGEEKGVGLFETGEKYFYELINRSLVQPVEIPHTEIIIGCRVNIMVLDMICFMSKEEKFVTVLDSHERDRPGRRQTPVLAIQNRDVAENEMLDSPHMRSFNATKCELQMMPSLISFRFLRVLALEDCAATGDIYHLKHIGELAQLRYLGLLNTPICKLPEGIANLKFLQTLDLRQTKIEELPHGIVGLKQLKCLRAGSRCIKVPDGMGKLASLEELELTHVSSSRDIVEELGKMREMRHLKLCIRLSNERLERDLVESLGNLQKMKTLHLDGGLWIGEHYWKEYVPSRYLGHVYLGMKFNRLPTWIKPSLLPNLSHLSVDVSVVEEEDLLILGSFPELISLNLAGEYVCLTDIMDGEAFPRLKYCYTSEMIGFLKGAAPRLEFVSFIVRLWGSNDGSFDHDFRSLLDHPLLQGVRVEILYTETHVTAVDKVEAALRDVLDNHLNSPILDISKWESPASEKFGSHYDDDGNDYYDDNEEDNDHEYYDEE